MITLPEPLCPLHDCTGKAAGTHITHHALEEMFNQVWREKRIGYSIGGKLTNQEGTGALFNRPTVVEALTQLLRFLVHPSLRFPVRTAGIRKAFWKYSSKKISCCRREEPL